MKWESKKPLPSSPSFSSSSSHSRPSFISHVSPSSWFSKIKLRRPRNLTNKGINNSCVDGGRFYSGDGDAFWRLSFGEDNQGSVDDELQLLNLSCRSKITGAGEDETQNFTSNKIKSWSFRKMTTTPERESTKSSAYANETEEDKESDSEPGKKEEAKSRTEKQRRSIHISREVQGRRTKGSSRIKIQSPRTKIKTQEDMKKSKSKSQKKEREKMAERGRKLESFAVAKCSLDPHKDFRDSMIEMIMEKKMNGSEELEELLACYLKLNSDEYHQLIIKVFRQVWFDLNINSG